MTSTIGYGKGFPEPQTDFEIVVRVTAQLFPISVCGRRRCGW